MISILDKIRNKERITLPQITNHRVCNPSIILQNDAIFSIYKGINFDFEKTGYSIKNYAGFRVPFTDSQNYLAEISYELIVKKVMFIEDRHIRSNEKALCGLQDLRIFKWRGMKHALGSAITHGYDGVGEYRERHTTMALFEVSGNFLELVCFLPSRQQHEKNWMPWVSGDDLFIIYSIYPYEILKFCSNNSIESIKLTDNFFLDGFRGGSCVIPYGDVFICIVHKKYKRDTLENKNSFYNFYYSHRLVVFGLNLEIITVSNEFTFESEDVEFCCGIGFRNQEVFLSYGINDNTAVLLRCLTSEFFDVIGLANIHRAHMEAGLHNGI